MTVRTLFPIALLACGVATAPAFAEEKREALYESTLDIDRDGKMDRAVLVVVGGPGGRTDFGPMSDERYGLEGEESVDLYIYLAAGDEKLDLSRKPTFLKKGIADTEQTNWVQPLENTGKGSLIATFVYGWGARQTWGESLTIVHRGGEFLVAGYTRDWEWGNEVHKADGSWDVETRIGGCDINYLTGKGTMYRVLDEYQPMKGTFKLVKLADWQVGKRPKACEF